MNAHLAVVIFLTLRSAGADNAVPAGYLPAWLPSCAASGTAECSLLSTDECNSWTIGVTINAQQIDVSSPNVLLSNGGHLPYLNGFYLKYADGSVVAVVTIGQQQWQASFSYLQVAQRTVPLKIGFSSAIGLTVYDSSTPMTLASNRTAVSRVYVPLNYDYLAFLSAAVGSANCSADSSTSSVSSVSFETAYNIPDVLSITVPMQPPAVTVTISGATIAQGVVTVAFQLSGVVSTLPVFFAATFGDSSTAQQTNQTRVTHVWQQSGTFQISVLANGQESGARLASGSLSVRIGQPAVILKPLTDLLVASSESNVTVTVVGGGSTPVMCTLNGRAMTSAGAGLALAYPLFTGNVSRSLPGAYADVVSCSNSVNQMIVSNTYVKPTTSTLTFNAQSGQAVSASVFIDSTLRASVSVTDLITNLNVPYTLVGTNFSLSLPVYMNVVVLQSALQVALAQDSVLLVMLAAYQPTFGPDAITLQVDRNVTVDQVLTITANFSDVLAWRSLQIDFGDQTTPKVVQWTPSSRVNGYQMQKTFTKPGSFVVSAMLTFAGYTLNTSANIQVYAAFSSMDTDALFNALNGTMSTQQTLNVVNVLNERLASSNETLAAAQAMRNTLVQKLSTTTISNVEDLSGVSSALNAVTATASQLLPETKIVASSAVLKAASNVQQFSATPIDQLHSVATSLISCISNILPAQIASTSAATNTSATASHNCTAANITTAPRQWLLAYTPVGLCDLMTYNHPFEAQQIASQAVSNYLEAQKQKDQPVTSSGLAATNTLSGALLNSANGQGSQAPVSFSGANLAATAQALNPDSDAPITSSGSSVAIPSSAISQSSASSVHVLTSSSNMYTWGSNSYKVNSPTVSINAAGSGGGSVNVDNLEEPIAVFLPRTVTAPTKVYPYWSSGLESDNFNLACHKITVTSANQTVQVKITLDGVLAPSTCITAMWNQQVAATATNNTFTEMLPKLPVGQPFCGQPNDLSDYLYTFLPPANTSSQPGDYYFCFKAYNCTGKNPLNFTYALTVVMSRCAFWNDTTSTWDYSGVQVGPYTTPSCLHCLTTHLTSFASEFLVPPNTIDFSSVWAKFDNLGENAAVFGTVVTLLGIYLIIVIILRRYDLRDWRKKHVTALLDNHSTDTYFYMITVESGRMRGAGTKSKVSMILTGEEGNSDERVLEDGEIEGFERGSRRNLLMSVPHCLGTLMYVRVSHDNAGGPWNLAQITVTDVQTRERYRFLCGDWLATDRGDGRKERLLPVATVDDLKSVSRLFAVQFRTKLTNDHLWLSVLTKPGRSAFTRVQRASCCMSLLFLSMLTNAMWYGTTSNSDSDSSTAVTVSFGPFTIETHQLFISIVTALIVAPVNILIVILFRRSDNPSRELARVHADDVARQENPLTASNPSIRTDASLESFTTLRSVQSSTADLTASGVGLKSAAKPETPVKKRPFMLHPVFLYLAWLICILTILGSGFFTILYSMQWGATTSNGWLTTFFLSFIEDVIIMQPVKVFAIAMMISCILRQVENDDEPEYDSIDVVEEAAKLKRQIQETNMLNSNSYYSKSPEVPRRAVSYMVDSETRNYENEAKVMARDRKLRKRASLLGVALRDFVIYCIFFFTLVFIVSNTRATNPYYIYRTVDALFTHNFIPSDNPPIKDLKTFSQYLTGEFLQSMYAPDWYNGMRAIWRDKQTINDDYQNYRIGVPRLRQVRLAPDVECNIPPALAGLVDTCLPSYQMYYSDSNNYGVGWNAFSTNNSGSDRDSANSLCGSTMPMQAWQYTSEPQDMPYIGQTNAYLPGGFVLELCLSRNRSLDQLLQVLNASWLDSRTRAVFIEFTLYNVPKNVYSSVTMLAEFLPTGGVLTSSDVKTFMLFEYSGPLAIPIFIFEMLFLAFFVYYLVLEILKIKREKIMYLLQMGNLFEAAFLSLCVVVVIVFSFKTGLTYGASSQLTKAPANQYVNMRPFALMCSTYDQLLAFLCFFATVKFVKLFNFNTQTQNFVRSAMFDAMRELRVWSIAFFVYVLAFAALVYLIFNDRVFDLRSYVGTFENLFSLTVGAKFNWIPNKYGTFRSVEWNPQAPPKPYILEDNVASFLYLIFLFTVYSFAGVFIVLIVDAFHTARKRLAEEKSQEDSERNDLVNYIWSATKSLIGLD